MAEPSLYLFDGYNLLHAGPHLDRRALVDTLASFVATKGVRGIVVFDGAGDDEQLGPLAVRFAPDADTMLERLAAEHRSRERVLLVTSDTTVLGTAGRQTANLSSQTFFRDLEPPRTREQPPGGLASKLDDETRERLERLRRGE
ncbi:MAG TPA: NYN domain-containing protein [Gaiellaceae bacterium]|jgi:predicted RNA-binding protein with PIN domain|nr:NYN domain-containing protein [Gaiellaceae bacterium]